MSTMRLRAVQGSLCCALVSLSLISASAVGQDSSAGDEVLDIGTGRQVFIDGRFLAAADGVELVVHPPRKTGERTLQPDRNWEGKFGTYNSVMKVGDTYHFWYRSGAGMFYARSKDGITWEKPILGLGEIEGSKDNNVVIGYGAGGVPSCGQGGMVFLDPKAPADQRFRCALRMQTPKVVHIFSSPDGIHWRLTHEAALNYASTEEGHHLDSQNVIFWDDRLNKYVAYQRFNLRAQGSQGRAISRGEADRLDGFAETQDTPIVLAPDSLDLAEGEQSLVDYYTNATVKYPWADDAYYMFPQAYYHYAPGCQSEFKEEAPINAGPLHTQFAASRDGIRWERFSRRPFVRLGMKGDFDCMAVRVFYGLVDSVDGKEMYLYYWGGDRLHGWNRDERNNRLLTDAGLAPPHDVTVISRLVLRRDGFVSVRGDYTGGQFVTPVVKFSGKELVLNVDTSATGIVQCEFQTPAGVPIEGYTLKDSDRIHTTNEINRRVTWQGSSDVSKLAGQPVRLHVKIRDADLYAFQFRN